MFNKLDDLKKIFPGIEILYKEATQEEVNSFFESELFKLDGYESQQVGSMNRKRIALLCDRLAEIKNKEGFCKNLSKYCPDIEIKNNQISIKSEKDLKNTLYALDERFYTTEISEEKRLANSIIKV